MNEIPPPRSLRAPAPEALSQPAGPPHPPAPRRARSGRLVRIGVALALVAIAALALLRQQLLVSTEHAVISSDSILLRSPIGGEVLELAARPGQALEDGALLARVENPLADRRALVEAVLERDRAREEGLAIAAQLAALDRLAATLAGRAVAHREEAARALAASVEEGARLRAAAEARARRSELEALRVQELARGGIAAPALRERAEAERDSALQEAAALAARGEALRSRETALARGFFLDGGYGGVAYLEQRLDEIALRRADLERQAANQRAALERATQRVAEETARHARESAAELRAHGPWHAWRVPVTRGQRISAEEVVAELLDCREVFVLAAVPQDDVPAISAGQPARIRLAGETTERLGTVVGWVPDRSAQEGGRLAALPTRPRGGGQVVQIAIAPPAPDAACPVGRTGRVLFTRPGLPVLPW